MFPLSLRILAALLSLGAYSSGRAQVLINEFLASNHQGLADEDGDSSDWIEMYNAGLTAVDLQDYHLTDRVAQPQKWTFPSRWLPPGSYLVIFASGKDRYGATLHTNFSLNASGEYLALSDAQGTVLSSFAPLFPPQSEDVSYGLTQPISGTPPVFFTQPTPGASNQSNVTLITPPTIQPTGKTFLTSLTVTLTSTSPGAEIRYTTNGTVPLASSPLYTGALTVSATTRLRAAMFAGGQAVSPITGETYLLLSPELTGVSSNLPMMIVDNFSSLRPTNGALAEWMIFEPDASSQRSHLTATPNFTSRTYIKVHGSSTNNDPKYSLTLESRNQLDQDRQVRPLGMAADSDWVLSAPYYYDRSLLHNALAYGLEDAFGHHGVQTRQVEVYLNTDGGPVSQSDYYGLYTFCEKITRSPNRVNIEKLHPTDNSLPEITGGYLLKIDRPDPGDVGLTTIGGQTYFFVDPKEQAITTPQRQWLSGYLTNFWTSLNGVNFRDPLNGYAAYLDIPAAVDYHLLSVALKNVDALRLSTFLSKQRGGKLTFGPAWDFDRSLESLDDRDDHADTWRGETGDLGTDFFRQGAWNSLFRDRNFWQSWVDRYDALRTGALSQAQLTQRISTLSNSIAEAQVRNFAKWNSVPPRTSWNWEVQHCKDWLLTRLAWMDTQFTRPATSNAPTPTGGAVLPGFQLTLTSPSLVRPGTKIYYTTNGSDPRFSTYQPDATTVLVASNAPAKGFVPTQDIGTAWHGSPTAPDPFDDSGWISGINGIGYDDNLDYDPFIGINLEPPNPPMKYLSTSAYQRIKFNVTPAQLASLQRLELRVHFDDGFAAFLNGGQIASENVPSGGLTWNGESLTGHPDSEAMQWTSYDVTAWLPLLRVGENTLALHGLNTPINSTDFLVQAELLGSTPSPELSASAIEYTAPVAITHATQVFARVFDPALVRQPYPYLPQGTGYTPTGTPWSAPLKLFLINETPYPSPQTLIISEIMYHPAEPTAAEQAQGWQHFAEFQYLVLRNVGNTPLNLAGVQFTEGITFTASNLPESLLQPGASAVVVKNRAAFQARYGNTIPILGVFSGTLSNDGERLILRGATGTLLQLFEYHDSAPWPVEADREGYALVVKDPLAHPPLDNPVTWRRSLDPTGETVRASALPIAQWQVLYFGNDTAAAALNADPDHDGLNNLVEYALGSSPVTSSTLPLRICYQGSSLCLEFERRVGLSAISILPLGSTQLNTWQSLGALPSPPVHNQNGTETVRILPAPASGQKFFRLQITAP